MKSRRERQNENRLTQNEPQMSIFPNNFRWFMMSRDTYSYGPEARVKGGRDEVLASLSRGGAVVRGAAVARL
jgi:hypothetical protein